MKILIPFCILMISGFAMNAQNSMDCDKFRTGNFTMYDSTSRSEIKITRTEKKQTEYHVNSDEKVTVKIKWTDDCTYVLYHKKYPPIEVRITNVVGGSYSFSAGPVGSTMGVPGLITKVE